MKTKRITRGFSLIEMAVVLLIVSTLLGGLLISLGSTRELNNRRNAQDQISEILEAVYGYAQANGRLPCPATAASNGVEARTGGADSTCSSANGFVPAVSLGLDGSVNTDTLLMDPWDNPYRYSISNVNAYQYARNALLSATAMSALATSADLQVCDSSACGTVLASNLPVVVLSLGADWANFSSTDEVENSGEATVAGYRMPTDQTFVSAGYVEDVFDDQLGWVSPTLLITRLIAAGQLP